MIRQLLTAFLRLHASAAHSISPFSFISYLQQWLYLSKADGHEREVILLPLSAAHGYWSTCSRRGELTACLEDTALIRNSVLQYGFCFAATRCESVPVNVSMSVTVFVSVDVLSVDGSISVIVCRQRNRGSRHESVKMNQSTYSHFTPRVRVSRRVVVRHRVLVSQCVRISPHFRV